MPLAKLKQPRKTPLQERSTRTVESIYEATIHVLIKEGFDRSTTTRIADRAGVSIGSLYQYFPDKQSLMVALLERHLVAMLAAMEIACLSLHGATLQRMAAGVVDKYFEIKWADAAASTALYSIPAELGRNIVARVMIGFQSTVARMLNSCSNRRLQDLETVSFTLTTSLVGPAQGLLGARADLGRVRRVQNHLRTMATAYLTAEGRTRANRGQIPL